MGLNQRPPD